MGPTQQAPGSSGLGLGPVSAQLGATRRAVGLRLPGGWTGRGTDARSTGRAANLCGQAGPGRWLSVCGGCWGLRKGQVLLGCWLPPAAPGAVTLSDAGLGTWRETQPRGFTGTRRTGSKEHSRGAQRCWAWRPTAPTGCLVATISSAKGKEEPVSPLPRGRKSQSLLCQGEGRKSRDPHPARPLASRSS